MKLEILKENIKKTEETIKELIKIQKEQDKKHKQLIKDCDVGIEINTFVLGKLKEESKLIS